MRQIKFIFWNLCLILWIACTPSPSRHLPSSAFTIATMVPIGDIQPFSSRLGMGASLVDLLYPPLFQISADGSIQPRTAQKISWEENGSLLRVVLAKNTAEQVKYSFETVKTLPGGDFSESLKNLDTINILSPNEIVFKLKKFDRSFPVLLSQLPIIPKPGEEAAGEFFIQSQTLDEVVLKRRIGSADKVNLIRIKVIPSPRRAMREFVAGNVDMMFLTNEGDYKVLADLPELELGELKSRMIYLVLANRKIADLNIPWSKVNHMIDRKAISEEFGPGRIEEADLPIPNEDPWLNKMISHNFEGSKNNPGSEKFNETGIVKRELSFLGKQTNDRLMARLLKRRFEEIGIELTLNDLSPSDFEKQILEKKDFDLVLLNYNIKDILMSNYFAFHSPDFPQSLNLSGYSNLKVDRYLEEARYTEDDQKAKAAFAKAMEAMADDPPGLFLFWLKTPIVYRKSCSGFNFNSNEFFSSLKDVRCEPSAAN
jgi:ABC-type transport system substrate-binding protein